MFTKTIRMKSRQTDDTQKDIILNEINIKKYKINNIMGYERLVNTKLT